MGTANQLIIGISADNQWAAYLVVNLDKMNIDEDDIRDYYDRSRITHNLVSELSDDLHNEWIEYYEDEDGDYCLDGELSDYI